GDAAQEAGARIRIFQIKFEDCREAQVEALAIVARKLAAQRLIKQEARFEIRTGERVFDGAAAVAQIQPLAAGFRCTQQAREPSTQVSGLGDIWLAACLAAQGKGG